MGVSDTFRGVIPLRVLMSNRAPISEVAEAKTVVSRLCETGEQAEELIDVQQSICRALVMLSELRSTMTVS